MYVQRNNGYLPKFNCMCKERNEGYLPRFHCICKETMVNCQEFSASWTFQQVQWKKTVCQWIELWQVICIPWQFHYHPQTYSKSRTKEQFTHTCIDAEPLTSTQFFFWYWLSFFNPDSTTASIFIFKPPLWHFQQIWLKKYITLCNSVMINIFAKCIANSTIFSSVLLISTYHFLNSTASRKYISVMVYH